MSGLLNNGLYHVSGSPRSVCAFVLAKTAEPQKFSCSNKDGRPGDKHNYSHIIYKCTRYTSDFELAINQRRTF